MVVLEKICFSQIHLTKELRDKIYNSLAKFAEIHQKTTQVIGGLEQQKGVQNEKITKNQNYNIDFLLIHLRDTLHGLHDNEIWFHKIIRRAKNYSILH